MGKCLSDLDVGGCIFFENLSIETFNISFESRQNMHRLSRQNMHRFGTKIIRTKERGEILQLKYLYTIKKTYVTPLLVLMYSPLLNSNFMIYTCLVCT